jgi:hypothetical protein
VFCYCIGCHTFHVAPLLWPSVGVKPNTWKSWELESSGTPECSELNSKGISKMPSHWQFGHLQPKLWAKERPGVKRPLKVGNRCLPDIRFECATWCEKISTRATTLVQTLSRSNSAVGSYRGSKFRESRRDNFGTPFWESREFVPFGCSLHGELQRIL